jgi:hypothetical protein
MFLKINEQRERDQGDFPDNNRIMVLVVRPLAFMTAFIKNKTSEKSN